MICLCFKYTTTVAETGITDTQFALLYQSGRHACSRNREKNDKKFAREVASYKKTSILLQLILTKNCFFFTTISYSPRTKKLHSYVYYFSCRGLSLVYIRC